jgi:hypothetical protein
MEQQALRVNLERQVPQELQVLQERTDKPVRRVKRVMMVRPVLQDRRVALVNREPTALPDKQVRPVLMARLEQVERRGKRELTALLDKQVLDLPEQVAKQVLQVLPVPQVLRSGLNLPELFTTTIPMQLRC